MSYNKIRIFFLVLLFSTLIGCGSVSNTVRYGSNSTSNKTTEKKIDQDSLKFSSEDNSLLFDEEVPESEDPSDLPEDESEIELSEIMKKLTKENVNSDISSDISSDREKILMEIIKYLGTPYKFGGTTMNGIDCSAFTQTVYQNTILVDLLRSARQQFTQGTVIENKDELEFGDLVFFNTRRRVRPGHVGIYIGDDLFAHASSKHGVTISSMNHQYYSKRYMGARRFEEEQIGQ